jgi:hypothetical protein
MDYLRRGSAVPRAIVRFGHGLLTVGGSEVVELLDRAGWDESTAVDVAPASGICEHPA